MTNIVKRPEGFRIWALRKAAKVGGMTPHAETTAKYLMTMELEGLVRQADTAPVWYITDRGRAELSRLESAHPSPSL